MSNVFVVIGSNGEQVAQIVMPPGGTYSAQDVYQLLVADSLAVRNSTFYYRPPLLSEQQQIMSPSFAPPVAMQSVAPPPLQDSAFQAWLQQQQQQDPTNPTHAQTVTQRAPTHSGAPQQDPPSPPPAMKVMCCYHKNNGNCSKGKKCWYSHEGDLNTPCHYGAKCVAGHASLTLLAQRAVAKSFDESVQEMFSAEKSRPTVRIGGPPQSLAESSSGASLNDIKWRRDESLNNSYL